MILPIKINMSQKLKMISEAHSKKEKIELLLVYDSKPMRTLLKCCFDPDIHFRLPKGRIPFQPSLEFDESWSMLQYELKSIEKFIESEDNNLSDEKVLKLFIRLLETIDPADAELMMSVKDKKLPYKGLTPKLIQEVFTDLF